MDDESVLQKQYCGLKLSRRTLLFMVLLMIPTALFVLLTKTQHSIFQSTGMRLAKFTGLDAPPPAGPARDAGPTVRSDGKGGNQIVLLTYGRSGSTLVSQIISQDPNVFYTFEPLFNLIKRYLHKGDNFTTISVGKTSFIKDSIDIVEVFLTCSFETMSSADINNFQLYNSRGSRLLYRCVQDRPDWTSVEAVDCFIKARKTCLQRSVKMVKTIRLRGSAVKVLMERNPDLTLLYLTRDPRGTLTSQHRVFHSFQWDDVARFAADFCQTFREDLSEIGLLVDRFPNRVKLLRYENLAQNPFKVSRDLYRALGLNYTNRVRAFVLSRNTANSSSGAFHTTRKNSTLTAYFWRTTMTVEIARSIDTRCSDIYQALGYVPVESARELRNLSRHLLKPAVFHGQML